MAKLARIYFKKELPGSLLLEILVVIGLFAILVPITAQVVVSSLNANKAAVESMAAAGLIEETVAAVESVTFSSWQSLYSLTKGTSTHYFPAKSAGAWSISAGDETVAVNNKNYIRYFTISNVCRDDASKNIITASNVPPCTAGNSDDPSTQMISIYVSWDGRIVSKTAYLTRWRNRACIQTEWTGTGAGPVSCPSTVYESQTNIDSTGVPGSITLSSN